MIATMPGLILFYKPYGVLSQFTDAEGRPTLSSYLDAPGFRVAGRLDLDSEGLLLLTDDGKLQARIANPRFKQEKFYWVQVEGEIDEAAVRRLRHGVDLRDGPTLPARARRIPPPPLPPREAPIRVRQSIPTSWLELVIREGRNRQVRRMTAHVGFPTLRLVRHRIGDWSLAGLLPGGYHVLDLPAADLPRPGLKHRKARQRAGKTHGKTSGKQ